MNFQLSIALGNEAMQHGEDIADALRKVADKMESCLSYDHDDETGEFTLDGGAGTITDRNGNKVGEWGLSEFS